MRNFDYIKDLGIDTLYRCCAAVEENQVSNPDISAISARRALEYLVREIYKIKGIEIGERTSLLELVDGEPFSGFIGDERAMMAVHYVRKVGNNAAHLVDVSKREAFFSLLNIYNVVGAVLLKLRVVDDGGLKELSLIGYDVLNAKSLTQVASIVEILGATILFVETEGYADHLISGILQKNCRYGAVRTATHSQQNPLLCPHSTKIARKNENITNISC